MERIRPGIRIELDEASVRFVGLNDALALRGESSARLWGFLSDYLVNGVDIAELLQGTPDIRLRTVIESFVQSLRDKQMLQILDPIAGNATAETFELSTELQRFIDQRADRPRRTKQLVCTLRLRFAGPPELGSAVREVFSDHALPVQLEERDPDAPALAQLTFGPPSDPDRWVVSVHSIDPGMVVLGPLPADDRGTATAHRSSESKPADFFTSEIVGDLLGSQFLLVVIETAIADTSAASRERSSTIPQFYVTDRYLVSERHPRLRGVALDELAWESATARRLQADSADVMNRDWSAQVRAVWDPVLGKIAEPIPADLPQNPYGLATSATGDVYGSGPTTADALWDVFASQFRAANNIPGSMGIGLSAAHAATDLVQRNAAGSAGVPVNESELPELLDERCRRAIAQLALDSGLMPQLKFTLLDETAGLIRCDVCCSGDTMTWTATGFSESAIVALERMNALMMLRRLGPTTAIVTLPPLSTSRSEPSLIASAAHSISSAFQLAELPQLGLWFAKRVDR
ncbi:MAG: hypothetical protein AAGC66_00400 [Leifsonia sp.]